MKVAKDLNASSDAADETVSPKRVSPKKVCIVGVSGKLGQYVYGAARAGAGL